MSAIKHKAKLLFIIVLSFLLVSCSNSYERSSEAGRIIKTDMEEIQKKIDNKETFVMSFTQSFCSHCIDFRENVLIEYLAAHEVYFYDIVIDELPDRSAAEAFGRLHPRPSKFVSSDEDPGDIATPTFYFVKQGDVDEIYVGEMDEETFDQYVQKYQLDKAD